MDNTILNMEITIFLFVLIVLGALVSVVCMLAEIHDEVKLMQYRIAAIFKHLGLPMRDEKM